ncbi:hypothetical protein GCM10010466_47610 [Planomonospora alba]|uniref:Uncharacterized protein n=1 Tax=Planomonospora alba TaxID=161354 RepID=A0ABP6NJW3_9ACTN
MKRIIATAVMAAGVLAGTTLAATPAQAGTESTTSYSVKTAVVKKKGKSYLTATVRNKTRYKTVITFSQKVCKKSCKTVKKTVTLSATRSTTWTKKLGKKGWRTKGRPGVSIKVIKPAYTISVKPVFALDSSDGAGWCSSTVVAKGTIRNNTTATRSYWIEGQVGVGKAFDSGVEYLTDVKPGRTAAFELTASVWGSWCSAPAGRWAKITEVEVS